MERGHISIEKNHDCSNFITKSFLGIILFINLIYFAHTTEHKKGPAISTGVLSRNLEELKQALMLGQDVNIKFEGGSNGIQLAVWSSINLKAVKPVLDFLLSQGADINNANQYGQTALHMAVQGDKADIVEYLLGHGANVNSLDLEDTTPLMLAAWKGFTNCVTALLSHPDIGLSYKSKSGLTVLDYARKHPDILHYISFLTPSQIKKLLSEAASNQGKPMQGLTSSFENSPSSTSSFSKEEKNQLVNFAKTMRRLKKGDLRDWDLSEVLFWVNTIGLPEKSEELFLLKEAIRYHKIDGTKLYPLHSPVEYYSQIYNLNEVSIRDLDRFGELQVSTISMLLAVKRGYAQQSTGKPKLTPEEKDKILKEMFESDHNIHT